MVIRQRKKKPPHPPLRGDLSPAGRGVVVGLLGLFLEAPNTNTSPHLGEVGES
jgi:hypothetical protein